MSTRSIIGYETNSGLIRAVYVHHDGYLSGVGKTLIENYDFIKLDNLLDLGDMSCLGDSIENSIFYARDRNETIVKARWFNTREQMLDYFSDCDYAYLRAVDDTWLVSERDSKWSSFNPLSDQLKSKFISFTMYKDEDDVESLFNAKDHVIDLVNEGEVEPMVMIKFLLDIVDNEAVEEMLNDHFFDIEINPKDSGFIYNNDDE